MIKVITFLGDRGALETIYSYGGETYTGGVFAEAIHQFCKYDKMLVCVTDKAKANTWPFLEKLGDKRITAVDIPTGRTNEEMWETFRIIAEQVDEGDHVIFDITHGLRSLPFLVFLFAAYLKAAKNVTIDAIYYGALELRESKETPAPVIDLSGFVSMIDWITATDQFIQTGDARQLSKLLTVPGQTSNVTKKAAKTLFDVSLSTLLCQPLSLSEQASNLEADLLKAQEQLQRTVPPFEMLRQRITDTFGNFVGDFQSQSDPKKALKSQLKLIKWYLVNNRLMEAMTLAREWLINAVIYRLGLSFTLNIKCREEVTKAISGLDMVRSERLTVDKLNKFGKTIYENWIEKEQLAQLWNILQPIRNTLDHAGHQEGAMSIKRILQRVNQFEQLLDNLAKVWELGDDINTTCDNS